MIAKNLMSLALFLAFVTASIILHAEDNKIELQNNPTLKDLTTDKTAIPSKIITDTKDRDITFFIGKPDYDNKNLLDALSKIKKDSVTSLDLRPCELLTEEIIDKLHAQHPQIKTLMFKHWAKNKHTNYIPNLLSEPSNKFAKLTDLTLEYFDLNDLNFIEQCPQLERLSLLGCTLKLKTYFIILNKRCQNLKHLNLTLCHSITGQNLIDMLLRKLNKNPLEIVLDTMHLTNDEINKIQTRYPFVNFSFKDLFNDIKVL